LSTEHVVALCAALALAYGCWFEVRRSIREGEGPVTVLGLFLAVWAFALGLFAIPWVRYDRTSFSTWLVIYGSLVTFSLGCVVAHRRLRGHRFNVGTRSREFDPARLRIVWLGAMALGVAGLAGYVHAVNTVIGWHAILQDPRAVLRIQSQSQQFKSGYGSFTALLYFNYVAVLLWTVGLRSGAFSGKWRFARIGGMLPVVALLLPVNRQLIFILIVWIAAFHILWRPPGDARRLFFRIAVGVVILLGFFVAAGGATGSTLRSHPEIKRALTTQTADVLAIPYVYLTANPPLLSKLGSDPIRPRTYGQMTILPLVKLAHVAGLAGVPPEETGAFYPIPFDSYNSSTWLGPFLLDFGLVGCLILPLLCGFAFTTISVRAASERSLISLWLASLALYVVAFTPLNNQLTIAPTWELALLGPIVVGLCGAGLGPGERVRTVAVRLRAAPFRIRLSLVFVAGACLFALVLARVGIIKPRAPVLGNELVSAASLVGRVQKDGGTSDSFVLASRLQAAQPAFTYVPVAQPDTSPSDSNVIGVYAGTTEVTLTAHANNGMILTLRWPPPPVQSELLTNGDFTQPLPRAWISVANGVATVARRREPGGYVLQVTGTGLSKAGSTVVAQMASRIPDIDRGAVYELSIGAQRSRLRRALAVELRATYVDGTYEFATATIPPGNDSGMHNYVAVLLAKKRLFEVTAFVVDTGTSALRGGVRLTHAHLRLRIPT
jgi:oligosaccharide repeat unit polymerase